MKSRAVDDPLQGLDPEALLRQGAADGGDGGFEPPGLEELALLFPQFEILEFIGRGGMGAVYRVRQKELDRVVALKILPPDIGVRPDFSGRFAREARAMAKLNHPGIVAVHEFGSVEGLYFIVMEYVDGVNLRALLRGGRMAPREALAIVPQICDALQYAHDHGIVHRDIKPENILIDRQGRVKVADFGLAKLAGPQAEAGAPGEGALGSFLTEPGLMGTPAYMAPEQREHPAETDHRADIYALGVVLYQMLTGELPEAPLEPPSCKVVLDVRLDEVVLKALESEPARRYAAASEFKTGLETAATGIAGSSAAAGRGWQRMEYRSRATVFGWPLVHVAMGGDPATGRAATARGIIAIGDRAVGVVAMGG
ncbi:MAG: serine/threonine protein kinase, partial [Chthoniobacterales bacterium]|nr:serine/threonine protein kinase [Chthoniobacterales bacterium]